MSEYCERCVHTDAEIARLTKERDELTKMAREAILDYPFDPKHPLPLREAVWGLIQGYNGVSRACDDLRAELERKEAALKAERQCAVNFAEQFAECQWIDMGSHFEVRGPVELMLDSEFAEWAYMTRRGQPKVPQ